MKSNMVIAATAALTIAATGVAKAEPQAEVLHWWTSGGEAKSVAVLQEEFSSRGGTWTDMPVAGGGGDAAMTALRARVRRVLRPRAVLRLVRDRAVQGLAGRVGARLQVRAAHQVLAEPDLRGLDHRADLRLRAVPVPCQTAAGNGADLDPALCRGDEVRQESFRHSDLAEL